MYSGRRRRQQRAASYELTVRVDNDDAVLLVDIRQSLADDFVEVTLVKVTGGHVEVTFVARETAFWAVTADREKVVLRSNDVNIADGDWHRVEIIR